MKLDQDRMQIKAKMQEKILEREEEDKRAKEARRHEALPKSVNKEI